MPRDRADAAAQANDRRRERLPDALVQPQEGALDRPRDPLPTRVQDLPPLPAAYADALEEGLRALSLDLPADARTILDGHVRLLLAWTTAINLTAIREPADVARLHVLDSLAAAPVLRSRGIGRLLDLGSGGGFPGIPLAAALGSDRTLLVDSVGKKVRFLETVIRATGLERRVAAEAQRSEAIARDPRDREAWPAVTARAVTSLAELVELALPLVAPGGVLVAWKRYPVDEELDAAAGALRALRAGRPEIQRVRVPGLEDHRLIIVPRDGPIDVRYPREPSERRRRPL
jgi:16S rRNA (guanine527-N7)-methyltransferase